ncbi:GAD-like domain-containing protein [Rhizobium oryziradicis]|uniref:GAD-related domain-containing protein n=1 Tax=Rhizobium oryziradicis TaxID=1867956 RepID=A0A1Q8ZY73_9HYPH|nr:GAD-like domain-containing protein [Rhizobium oryziradicis]OLP47043.1 hypothetical protein BJF95_12200 [Rhizobium oryziradicis]
MAELFINYKRCLEKYGEPSEGELIPDEVINIYNGRIPETYLNFLRLHGTGKWLNGYFQLCNPAKYQSIISLVLENDKIDHRKTIPLGFTSFGEILAWNIQYKLVEINILYGRVSCPELFNPDNDPDDDITLGVAIGGINTTSYDLPDHNGKPMFKRALKMHGELEFGQIYAPKLHPALGGVITVENLRPANALAAMTIAAQAGPFTLYDTTKPSVPAVRTIGE